MCDEGIDPIGFEKLYNIIEDKQRDIRRFKRGFLLTLVRNVDNKDITHEEAVSLATELGRIKDK